MKLVRTVVKQAYRAVIAGTVALLPVLGSVETQPSYAASLSSSLAVAPVATLQNGQRSDFIMGADVSELYELEKANKKFYDTDGLEKNCLQILKNHGVNYIRLRLWNDPTDAFGDPVGGGNTDLARDIAVAKAAKELGMNVLLDFHYSDFWADPGKQNKPKIWLNDSGAALRNDVYQFTYNTLTAMQAQGAMPNMVQIGNEINSGLLWPDGNTAAKAAPFLQSASKAARDAGENIKIMIHIAGNSSGSTGTFTDDLNAWTNGSTAVDFDVIGISDYPYWHGTTAQNATIMNTLAATYGKPVVVAETAYAWTLAAGDETINNFDQSSAYTAGYTATPQGQAAALRDVINNVASVPNNQGLGIFYWGADWLPGNDTGWAAGQASGWENQALFDFTGHALPSIDVFQTVRTSTAAPASDFETADPVTVSTAVYGTLHLPATVKGQYSDGYYHDVAVSSWDASGVDLSKPGIYTAHGTINGNTQAATAIVSVQPAQPANLLTNPGFESGSSGWTSSNPSIAAPQGGGSNPRTGTNAIHYWNGSNFSNATVTQTVYVPNGTYTLSAYIDGDAKGSSVVPYLFATGYDGSNPAATVKQNMTPKGWKNFEPAYSLTVTVTSGFCTIGVNSNGVGDAWGDVDDFYFGLPPIPPSSNTFAQSVVASAPDGATLLDGTAIPVNTPYIKLSTSTPGATVYYSTGGSDPSYGSNSSTTQIYTGPIRLAANTVLKAYASAPGYVNSAVTTYHFVPNFFGTVNLMPDGEFEQVGQLGAWKLTGVSQGDDHSTYVFDTVQKANDGTIYAGNSSFNYWSNKDYQFTLSQKVTGLQNGVYTLSAASAGGSNMKLDTVGRATYDPNAATLTLNASTPASQGSTYIINQGTTPGPLWWNIWKEFSVRNIQVVDGSVTVSFNAAAPASQNGYWGYLDHVKLVRTGDLPAAPSSGDDNPPGNPVPATPPSAPQPGAPQGTIDPGHITLNLVTDSQGVASVSITSDQFMQSLAGASDRTVTIEVRPANGTNKVQVGIPVQQAIAAGESKVDKIKVDTGLATVTITADLLKNSDGKELRLSVAKADTSALPADAQTQLGGNPVYDFDLSLDGRKIGEFNGSSDIKVQLNYTSKVGEKPGNIVVYYVDDNGKLEVVKNAKYNPANGKVEFKPKHFSKYAAAYDKATFADISGVAWAIDSIEALASRGVVAGVGGGNFNPDGKVTRAEFITMLMNAFDLNDTNAKAAFNDVQDGAWYAAVVASAQKLGIVQGQNDGSFGVNERITRQDMAVMIYRLNQLLKNEPNATVVIAPFADQAAIAGYALDAVLAMQKSGIINGKENNEFVPLAFSTRAEAAAIIYRMFSITQ